MHRSLHSHHAMRQRTCINAPVRTNASEIALRVAHDPGSKQQLACSVGLKPAVRWAAPALSPGPVFITVCIKALLNVPCRRRFIAMMRSNRLPQTGKPTRR